MPDSTDSAAKVDQPQRRSQFIGGAAIGAAAAGAIALGLPVLADSAAANDVPLLNFLLLNERVLTAFHEQAAESGTATDELQTYLAQVAEADARHVDEITKLLGSDADTDQTITFDQSLLGSPEAIATAANSLKDIAISAYNGQAGNLTPEALATTVRLVAIDARHAGWIATLAGVEPVAPQATDPGANEVEVRAQLVELGVEIGG